MGLIRLGKDHQVMVPGIDAQHEELIVLINEMHKAMTRRSGRAVLDGLMARLIGHTQDHFSYEEQLMLEHRYPGYDKHKREHERLLQHIRALDEQYRGGDLLLSFAVIVDLKGWALVHIEKFDVALGRFLNRAEVMPGFNGQTPRTGTRPTSS